MDYLRSLSSAAASAVLAKSGIAFPFSLGEKVVPYEGRTIWTLHDGIKRDDSTPVSVFVFDSSQPASAPRRSLLPLAKNALRKLRTIRHPDVLKFIDVVETDSAIYIVTERVQPLVKALAAWSSKSAKAKEDWLVWGLHRITVALAFVNDSVASTHGNVRIDSVFIAPSGEWKLGGFELLSSPKEDTAVLYSLGGLVPDASANASPEIKKSGWSVLKELDPSCADSYALGLLIHSVFNVGHPLPPTAQPPHPPPQPSSRGSIPTSLFVPFKRLLNPSPKHRLNAKGFLELGMSDARSEGAGFFVNNNLVKTSSGLEHFSLSSEAEKSALLRTLKDSAESFPPEFASYKILPALVSALEFGGASATAILPLLLQFGKLVAPADYPSQVVAPLVKLFASPDRGTRMALLDHLPEFVEKLDQRTVVDKVWPHLQTGFGDTVAVIREATVRSIILISPKLTDRILNNELLRFLAKTQLDSEASIRTNTCILIGRIAPSLSRVTKQKMLVPAFSRSLRDAFVHARVAGLMAFMATLDCYEPEEMAARVLPSITSTLVDKEKLVRDQAFKAVELFVKRLESHAATMPVTAIRPTEPGVNGAAGPAASVQTAIVNSATGAAGALAGWAISSLGKQLGAADLAGAVGAGVVVDRPVSAPPPVNGVSGRTLSGGLPSPSALSTVSSPGSSRVVPSAASLAAPRSMQLRAQTVPADRMSSLLAEMAAEEGEGDVINAWDGEDLMDVNADADDWSAFETAPLPAPSAPPDIVPHAPPTKRPIGLGISADTSARSPEDLGFRDEQPPPVQRSLSTAPVRSAPVQSLPRKPAPKTAPSSPPVPQPSAPAETWGTFGDDAPNPEPEAAQTVSLAGMSKEEKAAEMARRREERKQRIAQLKEKKAGK